MMPDHNSDGFANLSLPANHASVNARSTTSRLHRELGNQASLCVGYRWGVSRSSNVGTTCMLKNLRSTSNPARGAIHARVATRRTRSRLRTLVGQSHLSSRRHVSRNHRGPELPFGAAAANQLALALPCASARHLTDLVRFACSRAPKPRRSGRCRLAARSRMSGKTCSLQMPRCGEQLRACPGQVSPWLERSA